MWPKCRMVKITIDCAIIVLCQAQPYNIEQMKEKDTTKWQYVYKYTCADFFFFTHSRWPLSFSINYFDISSSVVEFGRSPQIMRVLAMTIVYCFSSIVLKLLLKCITSPLDQPFQHVIRSIINHQPFCCHPHALNRFIDFIKYKIIVCASCLLENSDKLFIKFYWSNTR